jgi:hypothetical protein
LHSAVIFTQARERVTETGTPDLHVVEIRDFPRRLACVGRFVSPDRVPSFRIAFPLVHAVR